MLKKLRRRLKRWNSWRRYSGLNWFDKLLVLFGLEKSVGFDCWKVFEEEDE